MDGISEKKWFVYIGDHHEGPFSVQEIQGQLNHGKVSQSSYVWTEGMPDWKVLKDIPLFSELTPAGTPGVKVIQEGLPKISVARDTGPIPAPQRFQEFSGPPQAELASGVGRKVFGVLLILALILGAVQAIRMYGSKIDRGLQPYLPWVTEKLPFLTRWIAPIPKMEGVSPNEFEELKTAVLAPKTEPKVGIALIQHSPEKPQFYLASNLPENSQLDLYLEGNPDTLLNALSYASKLSVRLKKHYAVTQDVRYPDGRPIPRGEYTLYVLSQGGAPDAGDHLPEGAPTNSKILAKKTCFLGGAKDGLYLTRLKEFHEKVKMKADTELGELKQFAGTLESQLGQSVAKFDALRKGRRVGPVQKRAWAAFDKKWTALEQQLNQSFKTWTPDALHNDFYYGGIYEELGHVGQSIEKLHELHSSFFTTKVDRASFDIQVGETSSLAESSLSALKAKIEEAEKSAPTTGGLPKREGFSL